MAIYKNNNKDEKSIFSSVDFDDTNNVAFFFVNHELDIEKAKESLTAAGQTIIAHSYVKGHTVLVTQGTTPKEEVFQTISTAKGDKFELAPPEPQTALKFIKQNGWKIRGSSSVVGQSMTLFAAARGVTNADAAAGKLSPKFDPAMGFYAIFALAANFTNFFFGGQKNEDVKGLEKFDGIIADEVNRYLPEGEKPVSPPDVRKLSYMNDKELAEHNKNRGTGPLGVLKRNSVVLGEIGLRTIGSISMVIDYFKLKEGWAHLSKGDFKQAWDVAKTKNNYTRTAGYAMVAGKAMALLSQPQDPNNPATGYWQEIRQKVFWSVSSATEAVAQSAMALYSHNNKKIVLNGNAHYDLPGALGNTILTIPPYGSRFVLPCAEVNLDKDEIIARLLDRLPLIPRDKVPEVIARVVAKIVEYDPKAPDFSILYRQVIEKLEKYHEITLLPHSKADMAQEAIPENYPQKNWANDLATKLANSPPISDEPRKTGYAEKNPKKDYVNQPHLESSGAALAL